MSIFSPDSSVSYVTLPSSQVTSPHLFYPILFYSTLLYSTLYDVHLSVTDSYCRLKCPCIALCIEKGPVPYWFWLPLWWSKFHGILCLHSRGGMRNRYNSILFYFRFVSFCSILIQLFHSFLLYSFLFSSSLFFVSFFLFYAYFYLFSFLFSSSFLII